MIVNKDWLPAQGAPCLSPKISWDRLKQPVILTDMWHRHGNMDGMEKDMHKAGIFNSSLLCALLQVFFM